MTVAARAIQDGDQSVRSSDARLNHAAYISRRVCALGTNELSGGEDDDEQNGGPFQSSAHGNRPLGAESETPVPTPALTAYTGLASPAATKVRVASNP